MRLTFTLQSAYTGATYVAGPFNISGTTSAGTTYWLATGVTKNQLTAGYAIDTVFETLTGGTIASTGTCTTTRSWQITTPEPEPTTVSLQIYGKDLDISPSNASVYYRVNAGSSVYLTTITPLSVNCTFIGEVTGLTFEDVVVIGTDETYPIGGANSSTCPSITSSGESTYTYTVDASSGADYVAFTIDSGAPL